MKNVKVFQKSVKSHGQDHGFQSYGTIKRPGNKKHICQI